ncbi:hypothetical protein NPIL_666071 [Nephila pilipes]|uniref:Uncharacterized protein n=1 Tax=Nephila pilipes TaxID=299642 RepID=A0A8X6P8K1_NEPPI|nr:hypothetical protein NPIL_666071 [Nephila pilipes]
MQPSNFDRLERESLPFSGTPPWHVEAKPIDFRNIGKPFQLFSESGRKKIRSRNKERNELRLFCKLKLQPWLPWSQTSFRAQIKLRVRVQIPLNAHCGE